MKFTAGQIAEYLNGTVEGDPDVTVDDVSRIEEGKPGTLAFLSNPKYEKHLYTTGASIVLLSKGFMPAKKIRCTLVWVDDAYEAIASLLQLREEMKPRPSGIAGNAYVDDTAVAGDNVYVGHYAVISKGAVLGDNVIVHPQAYIGDNVRIGNGTVIHPGVKVYHDCIIGRGCTLHAGVVVGSDGFGFAPQSDKNYKKIPQVGNVVIEDHVEIGANCTIDRAMMGSTIIRQGVKLDNLIQVAHNVEIGRNTVIAAQTGIAGSTKVGADCMIGGQAGIVGHLTIADGTRIAAQSGVASGITEKNTTVQGSPSFLYGKYQRSYVLYKKLPQLFERLQKIEDELDKAKQSGK